MDDYDLPSSSTKSNFLNSITTLGVNKNNSNINNNNTSGAASSTNRSETAPFLDQLKLKEEVGKATGGKLTLRLLRLDLQVS